MKQLRRRSSVWTRLGWRWVTQRRSAFRTGYKGFWSFRNKYRWRTRFSFGFRRRGHLSSQLIQPRPLTKGRSIHHLSAGRPHPSVAVTRGGAYCRGHYFVKAVPSREQLDAQLEEYMSLSRSRLDKQLDDYMAMSRSRLDAELDEYMSMAGCGDLQWD